MPFAKSDHDHLIAPPEIFDEQRLRSEHGAWGTQALRAALAMEVLGQILRERSDVLFKGGTLLQGRFGWPPPRASVDVDLEARDPDEVQGALDAVVERFSSSGLEVADVETVLSGFKADLVFPLYNEPVGYRLRVDVLGFDEWPADREDFRLPRPWDRAPSVEAPSAATQAAQKMLMFADPPYGRDLDASDRARKSRAKDLFDLRCLGREDLDGARICAAAQEDLERKSAYLDHAFDLEDILWQARQALLHFAAPRPRDRHALSPMWRAYSQVRRTIQDQFTEDDLRITAGCAWHAIEAVAAGQLDWADNWAPAREGTPRRVWTEQEVETVVEPVGGFEPVRGLREAWGLPQAPDGVDPPGSR